MSNPFVDTHGRLALAIHEADAHVNRAEASLALAEARLRLLDATFAEIRALAQQANIPISFASDPTSAPAVSLHMSEAEFSRFMCVSTRTMAYRRKQMTAGVHFHFTGRRVVYHVVEATEFLRRGGGRPAPSEDVEQLAIDEVTRRRARAALRRTGGTR